MRNTWHLTILLILGAFLIATACARQEDNLPQAPLQVEANLPPQPESLPQPADPPRMAEAVIYEIDLANYSEIPDIPFYSDGEIRSIGTDTLKALEGGHHPWLNHAETIVSEKLNNLVPPEMKGDHGSYGHLVEKVTQKSLDRAVYRLRLSDSLYYDVNLDTFTDKDDHTVMFITKITMHYTY